MLSVFRGGCTRDAAESITGASLRILSGLVNKSLLQRESSGRYSVHELLRQFAEQKCDAASITETAQNKHSTYYLNLLQQREVDLKGHRQLIALEEIDADVENVRIAWKWASERKHIERLAIAANAFGLFLERRARYQEGQDLFSPIQCKIIG